jgi:Lamin Tail Domain
LSHFMRLLPTVTLLVACLFNSSTGRAHGDEDLLESISVFSWAEHAYPLLFAPGTGNASVIDDYFTRFYPLSGHYLGYKAGVVYGLGAAFSGFPDIGGGIRRLGPLSNFKASMLKDGFGLLEGDSLLVSEVMVNSSDGSADWIEFYSAGYEPVSLKLYQLRLGTDTLPPETLPDILLEPGQYVVIPTSADSTLSGPHQLHFNLGGMDRIRLFRGGVLVEDLAWKTGEAPQGRGFGRAPGPRSPGTTTLPTPGAANKAAAPNGAAVAALVD